MAALPPHEARAIAGEVVELHRLIDGLGRFEKAIAGDLRPHIPRVRDTLVRRLIQLLSPPLEPAPMPAPTFGQVQLSHTPGSIKVKILPDYERLAVDMSDAAHARDCRVMDGLAEMPEPEAAQFLLDMLQLLSPARQREIVALIGAA